MKRKEGKKERNFIVVFHVVWFSVYYNCAWTDCGKLGINIVAKFLIKAYFTVIDGFVLYECVLSHYSFLLIICHHYSLEYLKMEILLIKKKKWKFLNV